MWRLTITAAVNGDDGGENFKIQRGGKGICRENVSNDCGMKFSYIFLSGIELNLTVEREFGGDVRGGAATGVGEDGEIRELNAGIGRG